MQYNGIEMTKNEIDLIFERLHKKYRHIYKDN